MKTTELMIGDWVFNKHHKKHIQITPYDFFNHAHLPSGKQYFVGEPEVISGRDFEPIPLTAEILMVNNFEYKEGWDEWWHEAEDGFGSDFQLSVDGDYLIMKDIGNARIEYVHQLQHALRLCGLSELADNLKVEE